MSSTEPTFTRERAGPIQRLFLKSVPPLYRGWLAELLRGRCVMLLTTVGRKTGRPRTTGVSFMPVEDHFVIFSGWGVSSSWYRNVRANPRVVIQVGRRRIHATARLVEDPDRRRALMLQMRDRSKHCGPPWFARPILKLTRLFDYEGEIALAVSQGGALPVFEVWPEPPSATASAQGAAGSGATPRPSGSR